MGSEMCIRDRVKLSAAASPIVALPEDVKLSIVNDPVNAGDTKVLFSIVCVALSVTSSSVVLVNPSLLGKVYTFVKPGVRLVTLNLATFVSSTEFGILKFKSLIAKVEPKRIFPVPCADIFRSKLTSASSLACKLRVVPTFCRFNLEFPIARPTCPCDAENTPVEVLPSKRIPGDEYEPPGAAVKILPTADLLF